MAVIKLNIYGNESASTRNVIVGYRRVGNEKSAAVKVLYYCFEKVMYAYMEQLASGYFFLLKEKSNYNKENNKTNPYCKFANFSCFGALYREY